MEAGSQPDVSLGDTLLAVLGLRRLPPAPAGSVRSARARPGRARPHGDGQLSLLK